MSRRPHRVARLVGVASLLGLPVAGGLVFLGLRVAPGRAPRVAELSPGGDGRQPIVVRPDDALVISRVMRDNLAGLLRIQQAAARGDMDAVSRAAESWASSPGPARLSPRLARRLPDTWRRMGQDVHSSLRRLAVDARAPSFTAEQLAAGLSETVGACVACHGTYRLVVVPDDADAAEP